MLENDEDSPDQYALQDLRSRGIKEITGKS